MRPRMPTSTPPRQLNAHTAPHVSTGCICMRNGWTGAFQAALDFECEFLSRHSTAYPALCHLAASDSCSARTYLPLLRRLTNTWMTCIRRNARKKQSKARIDRTVARCNARRRAPLGVLAAYPVS